MNRHSNRKQKAAWAALATAAALCLALAPAASAVDFAQVRAGSGGLDFLPQVENGGFVLTVSGPDGFYERLEFGAGESPAFSIFGKAGGVLADGSYNWELSVVPSDAQRRDALEANQTAAKSRGGIEALVQSGSFAILGGAVVYGDETEPGAGRSGRGGPSLAEKVQVINQDLVVQGSICVGFDCVSSESFGFDTIRLKENNTRIKFEDTSVGTFPTTDWQLTANDSASGGANKFSIDDISNARTPFTIEANAPSNTLYVDSNKRIGIGTSTPAVEIHVKDGDSPALRLEQDTSSGFAAQSYDVAANEANFFIRDNTTGSKLPFRLRPGAPTSSIDVAANGDVGIGTSAPSNSLHVSRSNGTTKALVKETNGTVVARELFELNNNGAPIMVFANAADATVRWTIGMSGTTFIWDDQADGPVEMSLDQAGNMSITGQLVTGGPQCGIATPCDRVFASDYEVESIEEHAALMWANSFLPAVGPTLPEAPMNLSEKTGGILNELEKAHIYIEQLNARLKAKDDQIQHLAERLARLEEAAEPR